MPQIPSRLPREYEFPSPDHRTWYTGVVNTVLRFSNVLHLHQRVCHKVGDTMVRTSRFTETVQSTPLEHMMNMTSGTEVRGCAKAPLPLQRPRNPSVREKVRT